MSNEFRTVCDFDIPAEAADAVIADTGMLRALVTLQDHGVCVLPRNMWAMDEIDVLTGAISAYCDVYITSMAVVIVKSNKYGVVR